MNQCIIIIFALLFFILCVRILYFCNEIYMCIWIILLRSMCIRLNDRLITIKYKRKILCIYLFILIFPRLMRSHSSRTTIVSKYSSFIFINSITCRKKFSSHTNAFHQDCWWESLMLIILLLDVIIFFLL